ncbi:hypothetical protein GEV43_32495 [Actinomadura sp. J1-007]|nr:hypothetical protein [Actinomadura sp. J1-007]
MGAAFDGLAVALGSGGVGAVLARSLSVWLRHRTADVRVKVTRPDGGSVEVTVERARDPEAVIEDVRRLTGEDADTGTE